MNHLWKIVGVLCLCNLYGSNAVYFGKLVGKLNARGGNIVGEVYAVDSRTIHVRGLEFDGEDPDAVFFAGSSPKPSADGFVVPSEKGMLNSLGPYRGEHVTLTLPEGRTLKDVRWLSVWSRSRGASLADIKVPMNFDYPKPQKLGALSGEHLVGSDRIVVVDAQTFLIPNFTYDGSAPDAFFWVGKGSKAGAEGTKVPDENGGLEPLKRYDAKTLVLTLPGALTVFDIDWLSIWCKSFFVDFGHIRVPKKLNVPPSLKMLGVAPQTKLNCEVLHDDLALEVRWALAGESIVMQLVGKLEHNQYMSFGLSGDLKSSRMVGGDVIVAWYDRDTGKGHAEDYVLEAKAQCAGNRGVCPDTAISGGSNNVRLLNTAVINDFVMVTYQRPLRAVDNGDKQIFTNQSQAVIWAIGPLNSQGRPSYHKLRGEDTMSINFGRQPFWNCPYPEEPETDISAPIVRADVQPDPRPVAPVRDAAPVKPSPAFLEPEQPIRSAPRPSPVAPQPEAPIRPAPRPALVQPEQPIRKAEQPIRRPQEPIKAVATKPTAPPAKPWFIPPIPCHEPEDHVFYAHVGPTGGDQGYSAISGHVGWGIAWYINGLLIPEITVVRGTTYTFVVEGGNDEERPAKNHPFYITDDPEGGYAHKSEKEREDTRIFAGARFNREGEATPTGAGRLCEWTQTTRDAPENYSSFGAYQRTLKLNCEEGQPAVVKWRPDENTPDTVYYQCFTHRYLGYRIRVVDGCDTKFANRRVDASSSGKVEEFDYDGDFETDETEPLRVGQTQNRPSKPSSATHNKGAEFSDKFPSFSGGFPDFPKMDFPSSFDEAMKGDDFFSGPRPGPPKAKEVLSPNELPNYRPSVPQPPPIQKVSTPSRSTERTVTKAMGELPLAEAPRPPPSLPPFGSSNNVNSATTDLNYKAHSQSHRKPVYAEPSKGEDLESDEEYEDDMPVPVRNLPKYQEPNRQDVQKRPEPLRTKNDNSYNQQRQSIKSSGVDDFNPSSLVFETGFRPIKNVNGPVPPLGFEVSDQSLAGSKKESNQSPAGQKTPNFDPMFKASELEAIANAGTVRSIPSQPISGGRPPFPGDARETFRLDAVPPSTQVNYRPERPNGRPNPKVEGLIPGPEGQFFFAVPTGGQPPSTGLPPQFADKKVQVKPTKKPSFFQNVGSFFGFGGDRRQDTPVERQVIPGLPPARPGVQVLPPNGEFRPPQIPQGQRPLTRPQLLQNPQLVPFKGELPPPVPSSPGNLPQFVPQQQQRPQQPVRFPGSPPFRTQGRSEGSAEIQPDSAEGKNFAEIRIDPHENEGYSQVIGTKISFGGNAPSVRGIVEDVRIASRSGLPVSRSIDFSDSTLLKRSGLSPDTDTEQLILDDVWSKIESDEKKSGPEAHTFPFRGREERKIQIRRKRSDNTSSAALPKEHRSDDHDYDAEIEVEARTTVVPPSDVPLPNPAGDVKSGSPLNSVSLLLLMLPLMRLLV